MIYLALLFSLIATILIEGIIIAVWFRRLDFAYNTLLCNLLTNPLLNVLLWIGVRVFGVVWYWPLFCVLETLVVISEAFLLASLCSFRLKTAFGVSFLLNSVSLLTGILFTL